MKIYEYMKINAWVIKIHWISNTSYKMSCMKPVNKIFKHFRLEICPSRTFRSEPSSRKILHALEPLSLCAPSTEPVLQSPGTAITEKPMLCNVNPPKETSACCSWRDAPVHTREKAQASAKTQDSQRTEVTL